VTRFFDHPFWERGFRPFFFAGGAYAVASILLWVLSYNGQITPPAFLQDPMSWHAHEMIFGFAVAIVSGFLLTAVANWTGWSPVRKAHLASLLAVWVAGRVSMNLEAVPFWLGVVIEGIYLPFLAISLAVPLLGTKNVRNFIFLGMLGALFVCDMAFLFSESRTPLYVALGLIAMMISLIGGRVIPSFTVATLRRRGILIFQKDQTKLDVAAVLSLITVLVSIAALGTDSVVTAGASFIAAATHLARMRNYYPVMALKDPMLWILHVGYGWLVLGLVMVGVCGLGDDRIFYGAPCPDGGIHRKHDAGDDVPCNTGAYGQGYYRRKSNGFCVLPDASRRCFPGICSACLSRYVRFLDFCVGNFVGGVLWDLSERLWADAFYRQAVGERTIQQGLSRSSMSQKARRSFVFWMMTARPLVLTP
jgi:uncharacterized protein involved in response to NO